MKRLAIIGAGSSGLVTLKHLRDALPEWELVCFEKGPNTIGCWGNPYPGFVSTSTKFATQFACHRKWDCEAGESNRLDRRDYFRDGEYGDYLTDFARTFDLHPHIRLNTAVHRLTRDGDQWLVTTEREDERFDHVVICTGLAQRPKPVDTSIPLLRPDEDMPRSKTIVVVGGGESAADVAHRLADPALGNKVYLSLRTGIRVSPRYHPIRGVPSDFLRNRLMLSVGQDLRNRIGQKFVEARIRHQELFERIFPAKSVGNQGAESISRKRKEWDSRLTAAARDQLFNVFHTKSDDFLDDVAEDRIRIIGPPRNGPWTEFDAFENEGEAVQVDADLVCPAIGYEANLSRLFENELTVSDFFLGVIHPEFRNLFLVGYARPVIGNVPSISEMQAKLIASILSGKTERPEDIHDRHEVDQQQLGKEFPALNSKLVLPVEMFSYCDRIARMMDSLPTLRRVGSLRRWWRIQRVPASTSHYVDQDYDQEFIDSQRIHSPALIILLLLLIKLFEGPYRLIRRTG